MLKLKANKTFTLMFFVFSLLAVNTVHLAYGQDDVNMRKRSRLEQAYFYFPHPDAGYVTDIADLLDPDDEERIERWLWKVESKTEVEIIVVIISSISDYPGTPNRTIEAFATALFDKYKIGNMPANKGILFLVAVNDRKARIELGSGYGRSKDALAKRIMDKEIIPEFKKSDYGEGIIKGVKGIALGFAGVRLDVKVNWHLIILILAAVVLMMTAFSLFKSGKRGWGWICVGLLFIVLLFIFFIIKSIIKHMPRSHSSTWGSGGMGGFGGGFSGGGGGGGGATGSW